MATDDDPVTIDDRVDESSVGPGATALRRLLNMGVRPPPPTVNLGQVIGARFRIDRKLGAGGMGVVFLARDLSLGRDLAIKFPSVAMGDRDRLLHREAAALARLVHPNVVTVYEIGAWNEHTFVAMEYVPGGTARTWLAAQPRTARAILALYVDAGRGLAAAHGAGLVHRDFKPDNVLVGEDGRGRVADFGLAHSVDESEEQPTAGTPAYMAPEQRAHGRVGPPADQFAFAVALREALASTPRVAPHVERALRRALSTSPDARFPSMHALIAELERDPQARRRRVALGLTAAGGVAALTAIGTWATVRGDDRPSVSCAVGEDALLGAWDDARRAAMHTAFTASGRLGADEIFGRVATLLDARAAAWTSARVEACAATHQRGEQSVELRDLRMRCLDRSRDELRAVVDVLATGDAEVVDRAIAAVTELPPLARCDDAAALLGAPPLPDEVATRETIAAIDRRVTDADATRAAGRVAIAAPLVSQLRVEARATGYPPLMARAARLDAEILAELGRPAEAEAAFLEAITAAGAAHDDRGSFDGWRGLMSMRLDTGHIAGAEVMVAAARAAVARLDPATGAQASLDVRVATLRWRQGNPTEMLVRATSAHAWFTAHAPGTLEEVGALQVLARAFEQNGDNAAGLPHLDRAVAILTELLGRDHPDVADARRLRARTLTALKRFDEARDELADLSTVMTRAYGADSLAQARVDLAESELLFWQGDYERSVDVARRALTTLLRHGSTNDAVAAQIRISRAWASSGRPQVAQDAAREALTLAEKITPPSRQVLIAVLTNLGAMTTTIGDLPGAQVYLDRALALGVELYGDDGVVVGQVENARAANFASLGDHVRATSGYQRAIDIGVARQGEDSIDVLYARNNLAEELGQQGRWAEAVPHLEAALRGLERALGADHPTLCAPLALLAFTYAQVGRAADGVRAAERGIAIRAARGDEDDPFLRLGLGAALWANGVELARSHALVASAARQFRDEGYDAATRARADGWLRSHHVVPARR